MADAKKVAAAVTLGLALVGGAVVTTEGRKVSAELSFTVKGCVRAPLDGGTDCLRQIPRTKFDAALGDNAARYFGAGNCFPKREAVGAQCEAMPIDSCSGGK